MWSGKSKIQLCQVTLAAITSVHIEETIKAMEYSMRSVVYGDAVIISHQKPGNSVKGVRYVETDRLDSIEDYNRYILFELYKQINTEYVLIVHWDGFVVNPYKWKNDFLKYDYIGAPWPEELGFKDQAGNICRVGNGVSLRSKQLLEFPSKMNLEWTGENEDTFLCCTCKEQLERNGIQIAPLELAVFFSHERAIPEISGIRPFMFHQWGGDNAQYPRFFAGKWVYCKKQLIKVLIFLGIWRKFHKVS